ncbi:MAG: TIGR03790 family protein [Thermodesulfobacteriota bacterium]|nr:TIGR03790 family protein [Thermodesulfobacteriota bacterium]
MKGLLLNNVPFLEEIRSKAIKVARLDGPTPRLAKRLVDDSIATEKEGLKGIFYIDARGLGDHGPQDSYAQYDRRLLSLYAMLKEKASMEVVIDNGPELFAAGTCPHAALYCGWYSLRDYVDAFSWQKGAVGFHVASAEATTLRAFGSDVWCKRMIEEGVAATLGPVQEPYLSSFPFPDLFFPLLMTGKSPLLEVYFQTTPHLSWRQILIGDPLYTPFKNNPAISLSEYKKKKTMQ